MRILEKIFRLFAEATTFLRQSERVCPCVRVVDVAVWAGAAGKADEVRGEILGSEGVVIAKAVILKS